MPFILARLSVPVTAKEEQDLKKRIGLAMELIRGKSEANLLLGLQGDYHFFLRGEEREAVAYLEVKIFGNEDHFGFDRFTKAITEAFHEVLRIPLENIFLLFSDITAWAVNGVFFDRRRIKL